MKSSDVRIGARRVLFARLLLILPFLALAARAAHLCVDERGSARGIAQTHSVLRLLPTRGVIFDRNGVELALSIDAPSVYAHPTALKDPDRAARELARALDMDPRRVAERLSSGGPFTFVSRWISDDQLRRLRALEIDAVGVLYEPRRVYPQHGLAAQVIGFANIDGVGARGMEQREDDWLRGTVRWQRVERDARGQLLASAGDEPWSAVGGDIALTLDAALQADAEAALREAVASSGARGGGVLSMDPRSGEILALAEVPGFDPNRFRELDYRSTRLRSFLDAADPGSAMKPFLVAAALEREAVAAEDRFDCEGGSFRVPGSVIRDSRSHGSLSTAEILRVSSNIGAVKIAFTLGPRAHYEMLRRFGFGETTGSRFPGESSGLLRPWREWRPLDHATIAFGQGVSVTPIQLASATAALANGGEWVRPRLVRARRAARGPWQPTGVEVVRRVLRPATAARVLEMLEAAVGPGGTGRLAALRGVRVAGKTGTAQKFDPGSGSYADERFTAWFIGVVPADDPKLVIVASLDEPRRPLHTGGAAAAPLFAQVAAAQLARFGIFTEPKTRPPRYAPEEIEAPTLTTAARNPRTSGSAPEPPAVSVATAAAAVAQTHAHRSIAAGTDANVEATGARHDGELVSFGDRLFLPDFGGLTLSEVRRITADTPLDVKFTGEGRVVAQDPPAGTILAGSRARVVIHFEKPPRSKEGEG